MNFLFVRIILETSLLLVLGAAILHLAWRWTLLQGRMPSARAWLHAGYSLFAACLLLPPALRLGFKEQPWFRAPFELGHQPMGGAVRLALRTDLLVDAPQMCPRPGIDEIWVYLVVAVLTAMMVAGVARLAFQYRALVRVCRDAIQIRRTGRVSICVARTEVVPFCAWTLRRTFVIVPTSAVVDAQRLRLVLAHEFEHIRSSHLVASWCVAVARALTPWNPIMAIWAGWFARVQDLACDQALISRSWIGRQAYGECLFWAAGLSTAVPKGQLASLPMASGSKTFMKRRVEMLLSKSSPSHRGAATVLAFGLAALFAFATTARGAATDRRFTMAEAQRLADRVVAPHGFSVTVDDATLDDLNRIVSGARVSFRGMLARMKSYRSIAEPALRKYHVPELVLAIPIAESGVKAIQSGQSPGRPGPRGTWQMMAATARHYGLRVDKEVDQRFDPGREADAVARLLSDAHDALGDWNLAIAAYNVGTERIKHAIQIGGTRDPAILRKKGLLNGYLGSVVAAMIVLQAPDLVAE